MALTKFQYSLHYTVHMDIHREIALGPISKLVRFLTPNQGGTMKKKTPRLAGREAVLLGTRKLKYLLAICRRHPIAGE